MSDLTIEFMNNSMTEWQPDINGKHLTGAGIVVQEWPDAPLPIMSGDAKCVVEVNLSKIANGTSDFYYCWNNGVWRFGVKINVTTQVLGMGNRPTWQVLCDQTPYSSTQSWSESGDDPADQYHWPETMGYSVTGTPDSGHQSLSIQVQITDL